MSDMDSETERNTSPNTTGSDAAASQAPTLDSTGTKDDTAPAFASASASAAESCTLANAFDRLCCRGIVDRCGVAHGVDHFALRALHPYDVNKGHRFPKVAEVSDNSAPRNRDTATATATATANVSADPTKGTCTCTKEEKEARAARESRSEQAQQPQAAGGAHSETFKSRVESEPARGDAGSDVEDQDGGEWRASDSFYLSTEPLHAFTVGAVSDEEVLLHLAHHYA
ncbi:hypothetical protein IAT40_001229 [Kwoniella sp. CBS 6097]